MDRDEIERLLSAAGEAALADTLAGLWAHVLGVRTTLIAAGDPPNGHGLDNVGRKLWTAALERWVKPIADQVWADSPPIVREQNWAALLQRAQWTVDLITDAISRTLSLFSSAPTDQLRDQVTRVLDMDAYTETLRTEIAEVESALLDSNQSNVDRGAQFSRRVRLSAKLFMLKASRARSKGYAALANVDPPERAREDRQNAQKASRPAADIRTVEQEISRLDDRLYHNPDLEPNQLAQLRAKLVRLNGEGQHGRETWRNTITRDSRAIATGLTNSATLQYGLDRAQATGDQWVKQWVATEDDRTRPTHTHADGQVQPLAQPFRLGGGESGQPEALADFPGDFDLPPAEFWNCRCSMRVLSRAQFEALPADAEVSADQVALAASALEVTPMPDDELSDLPPVMWHGVITKEGVYTGDARLFSPGAMRTAALPLPIRFQREDWGGHTGAVVTANLEGARRFGEDIRAWGTFADGTLTPEVDEVQGLMATRMIRGISIDGDDVLDSQFSIELNEQGDAFTVFDSMRLRAATFVAIPAYDGAEVYLGPPPADWHLEGEPLVVEQNDPGDTRPVSEMDDDELMGLLAASRVPENLAEYWTVGEGAAKIAWGTPGDFNRCRSNLAQYVPPGQLSGMCANLHHRALGKWPGEEAALIARGGPVLSVSDRASSAPGLQHHELTEPKDWDFTADQFAPRELDALTPVTIDDDGSVWGHLAGWETCHTGFSDYCQKPPRSATGYALFHTGAVRLTDGTDLPIGKLTVGAGHANATSGLRAAVAHYDNSAVAVAMIRVHEDTWGVQASGVIIPGTPREKIEELRRSPISGDWRPYRGNLELIAGLGVNSPGFPIPRVLIATAGGKQLSLVAAGYVGRDLDAEVMELAARFAPTAAELSDRVAILAARITSPTSVEG